MENLRINGDNDVPQYSTRTVTQGPQKTNNAVYGLDATYQLENQGYISAMFLVFDLVASVTSSFPIPTSPYVIDQCFLQDGEGNIIAKTTTLYELFRLDQLSQRFYDQVVEAATIDGTFTAGVTKQISLPLFFYAVDGQMLDPRKYSNLSIRVLTKGSAAEMGMSQNLSSLEVSLKITYKVPDDYIPMTLKNSYNIYQNTYYEIATGTSSKMINLNLPFKVTNVVFMIRKESDGSVKGNITQVSVRDPTGRSNVYDNLTDFDINSQSLSNVGSTFVIPYGSRYSDSNFQILTGNMKPIQFTLSYTLPSSGAYRLFVCVEYLSEIEESNGRLTEVISGSYI